MKKYLPSILLAVTLPLGELHTYWENKSQVKENWIFYNYEPMTRQWNMKMVGDELIIIMYFVAMWYLFQYPNKFNKTTVRAFIWLAIADLILYFWNFKTYEYWQVYFWALSFWVLSYFWNSITRFLWIHLKTIGRK